MIFQSKGARKGHVIVFDFVGLLLLIVLSIFGLDVLFNSGRSNNISQSVTADSSDTASSNAGEGAANAASGRASSDKNADSMPSSTNAQSIPSWRQLRDGTKAYTGDDGENNDRTLTVCDSAAAYLRWTDNDTGGSSPGCAAREKGLPVTIVSDHVVAVGGPDYLVHIRADDSSWSGWTNAFSIWPRIPVGTKLTLENADQLYPDSDFLSRGEAIKEGTVVEVISQGAKNDFGELYVSVANDPAKKGWMLALSMIGGVAFDPLAGTKVHYQFDCRNPPPESHAYDTGDYSKAFKEIEPLATHDCPNADYLLGVMYAKGQGTTTDPVRAYAFLLLAASYGIEPSAGLGKLSPVQVNSLNKSEIAQFAQTLTPDQLAQGEALALRLAPPEPSCEPANPGCDTESLPDVIRSVHGGLAEHYELITAAPSCIRLNELTDLINEIRYGTISNSEQVQDYMDHHGCMLLPAHTAWAVTRRDADAGAVCITQGDPTQGDDGRVTTGEFCPGVWVPASAVVRNSF